MKNIVSAFMVTLILVATLIMAFDVGPVTASGTIYIRSDGSIYPPTANITTTDNVTYTFTGNNYDEIVVERNNIIVDGAGYTLHGPESGDGFYWSGKNNVTIRHTNIKNFSCGVMLVSSSNNRIQGNNIANNNYGIVLSSSSNYNSVSGNNITANNHGVRIDYSSSNNSLSDNVVNDNFYGIRLYSSPNNTLVGNHIAGNEYGIELFESSNNSLARNNLASNAHGIEICRSSGSRVIENTFVNDGLSVDSSYGNIVEDNTVNGSPLVYLESVSNHVVENAGQVILVNCISIQVESLELSNTTVGVELWATNNTKIVGNEITANSNTGIKLYFSANNSITRNNIAANSNYGICLYESSNNNVSENDITVNKGDGIMLHSSSNNSISGNNIANNWDGIWLYSSSGNSISGNNIANNGYGIWLDYSSSNRVFHNNLINNTNQLYSSNSVNVWDDGYPSGGNYWSDYTDVDSYKGSDQNETGSDGVWDHPYVIDGSNQDRYPLTRPFGGPAGDVDGDRDVDIFDIVRMAGVYGVECPDPRYNRLCDMDLDGDIDIFDIVIAAGNYGKSW